MLSRHPQESFPIKCLELFIAGVLTVIDIKIQGLTRMVKMEHYGEARSQDKVMIMSPNWCDSP